MRMSRRAFERILDEKTIDLLANLGLDADEIEEILYDIKEFIRDAVGDATKTGVAERFTR